MMDFLKSLFDFVVIGVILKIIVGHWLAERIMEYGNKVFHSSERNLAIWTHYQDGHLAHTVLACTQDKCGIFRI